MSYFTTKMIFALYDFYWPTISMICLIVGLILKYKRSRESITSSKKGRSLKPGVSYGESNTLGGGLKYIGHFRVHNDDSYVCYMFMTLFFLPIFPLLCIRRKFIEESYDVKKYLIYFEENFNYLEILSIYLLRWGGISFVISLAQFFS